MVHVGHEVQALRDAGEGQAAARTGDSGDAWGASSRDDAGRRRMLALSKYEAAGNDFLVLVDPDGLQGLEVLDPAEVRRLCDRRLGVGADGVLLALPGADGADLTMVLRNADGSPAEMSGNGIRCLVHAAVLAGMASAGTVQVATDAGVRTVELELGPTGTAPGRAAVDMGVVQLGRELESPVPGTRARSADVGNPHLVVLGEVDLQGIDLVAVDRAATALVGIPVNVEVVRIAGPDALALRVSERGVGETAACGTGSCAAAAVARSFALTGDRVTVRNPGGSLDVRLAGDGEPVVLAGPVRRVADVVVDRASLGLGDGAGARSAARSPGR